MSAERQKLSAVRPHDAVPLKDAGLCVGQGLSAAPRGKAAGRAAESRRPAARFALPRGALEEFLFRKMPSGENLKRAKTKESSRGEALLLDDCLLAGLCSLWGERLGAPCISACVRLVHAGGDRSSKRRRRRSHSAETAAAEAAAAKAKAKAKVAAPPELSVQPKAETPPVSAPARDRKAGREERRGSELLEEFSSNKEPRRRRHGSSRGGVALGYEEEKDATAVVPSKAGEDALVAGSAAAAEKAKSVASGESRRAAIPLSAFSRVVGKRGEPLVWFKKDARPWWPGLVCDPSDECLNPPLSAEAQKRAAAEAEKQERVLVSACRDGFLDFPFEAWPSCGLCALRCAVYSGASLGGKHLRLGADFQDPRLSTGLR